MYKKRYYLTVFNQKNEYLGYLTYVDDLLYASRWLNNSRKYSYWYYFNVYSEKIFLRRCYRNEYIPRKI